LFSTDEKLLLIYAVLFSNNASQQELKQQIIKLKLIKLTAVEEKELFDASEPNPQTDHLNKFKEIMKQT
ncbi:MAG TPA: hypothetical protein V6C96_02145, partial [Vampirovibrionales bacterium]